MRQLQSSTFLAICLERLKYFLINIILINHTATYYNLTEIKKRIGTEAKPEKGQFLKEGQKTQDFFY